MRHLTYLKMKNFKDPINNQSHEEILELVPAGVILVDHQGKIISTNSEACKIFEYSKKELKGQRIEILIPKNYRKSHEVLRNDFQQRPSKKLMGNRKELVGLKKDGSTFPAEISIGPFQSNGTSTSIAIVRDTSHRKYIKQLEFKNNELEQFAFIASHDLQEPLRAITGLIEITLHSHKGKIDETLDKNLEYISEAGKRMSNLINGLLDYARIGKMVGLKKIDINDILQEIRKDLAISIQEKKATINTDQMPTIKGYEVEIRLLFQNLISNAIKFSKPGIDPEVKITCRKMEEFWEFTISDNGIGIAPEHMEKIFVIFQRLHLKGQYEGSGIGLAHCKKIVELHNGRIWVESEPNIGSKFIFTLLE